MDGGKGGGGRDGRGIEGQSRDGGGKRDERKEEGWRKEDGWMDGKGMEEGRWMDGRERDRGREVGVSNGSSSPFVHGGCGLWSPFVLVSARLVLIVVLTIGGLWVVSRDGAHSSM